jgi:protein TonB
MLDDSLESSPEASTAGSSKKGLFLGLAAAALLLAGGGVWYIRQTHGVNSGRAAVKAVETPVPSQTVAVNSLPTTKPEPAAVPTGSNSPAATVSPVSAQPAKNSTANVVSVAPATVPKNTAPLMKNEAPVEQPKKPSLGEVHLSAPVVNRVHAQQGGEADPSLTAGVPTPGAESLSSLSGSTKEPSAPLPVGGDVKPARLIKSVPPLYPPVARTQRIAGSVSIDAVVDTDGNVSTMKVLSGPAILHRSALDAVKQWRYEPAMLDGKPTTSHLTVIVQFRLQ